jgi:hypothetical protein
MRLKNQFIDRRISSDWYTISLAWPYGLEHIHRIFRAGCNSRPAVTVREFFHGFWKNMTQRNSATDSIVWMEEDEPACCIVEKPWRYEFSRGFLYAEPQPSGLQFWLVVVGYWLSGQGKRSRPRPKTNNRAPITAAQNRDVLHAA